MAQWVGDRALLIPGPGAAVDEGERSLVGSHLGEDLVVHHPAGVGILIDDGMSFPVALRHRFLLGHRCCS